MSAERIFSSSSIYKLMTNGKAKGTYGKPFYTYVEDKIIEKRLGRSIDQDSNARATWWGRLIESFAFSKMDLKYSLVSKDRYYHPDFPEWSGMPDLLVEGVVGDIKCPWTIRSFCGLVDAASNGPEELKKYSPEYYWQLVSNAILCERNTALLVVYCPYYYDLVAIRESTDHFDGDQNKVAFVNWATDEELPYIIEGNYYKDLNYFQFEIPEEDKELLTERVKAAIKLYNDAP